MESITVKTEHYEAICLPELKEKALRYISDIEKVWQDMVNIFGKEPEIKKYYIDFTREEGVKYLGEGKICIKRKRLKKLSPFPKILVQGLTFEIFHGFLEHVKHRPFGKRGNPYYGENKLGESFSAILKIELLDKMGLSEDANNYRGGKGMGEKHHQLLFLLVDIHKKYGIVLFQKLFRLLENNEKPIITEDLPEDDLCFYFSQCAKENLSNIFEERKYLINSETKDRINSLLLFEKI